MLKSFGLLRGVSHTEFIRARDGSWNFLETSARVGGAFIVDVVEAATGVNLWREWARIEIAGEHGAYETPARRDRTAGIVLSLARQETPDMSAYTDPEIVIRVRKAHHAGLIVGLPGQQPRRRPAARIHGALLRRFPRVRPSTRTSNRLKAQLGRHNSVSAPPQLSGVDASQNVSTQALGRKCVVVQRLPLLKCALAQSGAGVYESLQAVWPGNLGIGNHVCRV